jgi:regulator of replication initiation timing
MNTVEIVSANEGNTAENLTNLFKRDYHVCRVLETASESNVLI